MNTAQKIAKITFKKTIFSLMEKYLSNNFDIWKNAHHSDLIEFSVRIELNEVVW